MKIEKDAAPDDGAANRLAQDAPQKDTTNIVPIEDNPVNYDIDALQTFIDAVFHTVPEGALVYTQVSTKAPVGFGKTPDKTFNKRLAKRFVGFTCWCLMT